MFVEAQMIADAPVLFNTVYIYNVKLLLLASGEISHLESGENNQSKPV